MMVDLKKRFDALDTLEFPHPDKPPTRAQARASQVVPRYTSGRVPVVIFALLVAAAGIGFAVDAFRGKPGVREPVPPPGTGTIAYVAFDGATLKWSLFTVEADGSPPVRIAIDLPGAAFHPSWSPDGTKLAFDVQSQSQGGDTEIYAATVYGSNGSNLSRLTNTAGWNFLPAWSPDGSRIAYVHTSGPNHDIWLMNADGSNPVRLTHGPDLDLNPTWSPDGSKLAFESNRTGSPEIYVMNADGSHVSRLTNTPGFDGSPAWSPDGRQIAFVSDRDGPGIYVMQSDGSDVRKVVGGKQVGPLDPEWSPDSASLAYASSSGAEMGTGINVIDLVSGHTRSLTDLGDLCCPSWRPRPEQVEIGKIAFSKGGPSGGIYLMNPDGSGVERLTSDPGDIDLAWSPDGSRIAFVRFRGGNADIYVMNANGSEVVRLTRDGANSAPAWSPDGRKIAFARAAPGNTDIYVMDPDGSNVTNLTNDPLLESAPAWSPDGSRIAFSAYVSPPGPVHIYTMGADGTSRTKITDSELDDGSPAWSPDGRSIAFVRDSGSIIVVEPDGSEPREVVNPGGLTGGLGLTFYPAWSPDGTKILFQSGPNGSDQRIYVVNVDGSGFHNVGSGNGLDPTWQPVPPVG
jgi:Tol biopolymer transport system component